jgi:hypothetical protein
MSKNDSAQVALNWLAERHGEGTRNMVESVLRSHGLRNSDIKDAEYAEEGYIFAAWGKNVHNKPFTITFTRQPDDSWSDKIDWS